MTSPQAEHFRQHTLTVLRLGLQSVLDDRMLHFARNQAEVEVEVNRAIRGLVLRLATGLLAKEMVDEQYTPVPADWWAHFKQRWFPRRWLRRWPAKTVRLRTLVINRVCPHVDVVAKDRHFQWLEYGDVTPARRPHGRDDR